MAYRRIVLPRTFARTLSCGARPTYPNVSDQVLCVGVAGLIADYPIGYREGDAPAPLVVSTHGGPASSNVFKWVTESEYIPQLTQLGYFVLQPNYRGSTGYGCEFSDDVIGA
jgi:hypothetical protein